MFQNSNPYALQNTNDALISQVMQMLQQGAPPEQVLQQLVEMGMPQDQATSLLQSILEQSSQSMQMRNILRADYGMEVKDSMLPNIENYPSYDLYKEDYNSYIANIDTTTTINWASLFEEEQKKLTTQSVNPNDTFARRMTEYLPSSSDTTDLNQVLEQGLPTNITPEQDIKKREQDAANAASNTGGVSPWWLLPAFATPYIIPPVKNYLYDKGSNLRRGYKMRYGTIPEINQDKLKPEEVERNNQRVELYKKIVLDRGFTVGKQDVNELVSRGMSRAEAQNFLDTFPSKKDFLKRDRQVRQPAPAEPASQPAAQPPASEQGQPPAQKSEFDTYRNKISSLMQVQSGDPIRGLVSKLSPELKTKYQNRSVKTDYFLTETYFELKQKGVKNEFTDAFESLMGGSSSQSSGSSEAASQPAAETKVSPQGVKKKQSDEYNVKRQQQVERQKQQPLPSSTVSETKDKLQEMRKIREANPGATSAQLAKLYAQKGLIQAAPTSRFENVVEGAFTPIYNTRMNRKKDRVGRKTWQKQERIRLGRGAMGGSVPQYGNEMYDSYLPQFSEGSYYDDGGEYTGTWNGNQGFAHGGMYHNPFEIDNLRRFVYADGGMTPEDAMMMQQQPSPEQMPQEHDQKIQEIMQAVANMLQQGAPPEQIMQQLVSAGLPEQFAQQIIQQVMQEMGGGAQQQMQQQAPQEEQMPEQMLQPAMAKGGSFNYSNLKVGQEMDVTFDQLEKLRKQGIQFRIL